jgi:hypothetical protein
VNVVVVWELRTAVAEVQGLFMNPEEGECLPLVAITRGLVKAELTNKTKRKLY